MKHVFLINPAAGKRGSTDALVQQIQDTFQTRTEPYEIILTQGPQHAFRCARAAAETGEPLRLYACGGDGTLNEVVNGAAGFDHVAVTNVPKGTGNDFLKIFGNDCRVHFSDLAALVDGPQAAFDLMDCNGKLGIGVICSGLDARVAADVHKYKSLPLVTGIGAYILSLAVNVLFKRIAQPTLVQLGPQHLEEDMTIICICNGRYYGGGFMPVGDAMPDDGVLDILVVPAVTRRTFLRLVSKYAKGRYREHPELIRDYHGSAVSFSSQQELVVVVDGEVMRDHNFTICLSPYKINFFYPKGLSYAPKT